jgi:GntR family transcriptional regulator
MMSYNLRPKGAVATQPLYQQVHDHLLAWIVAGEWPSGDYLPSEQRLAANLGMALGTVRRALDELVQEGVVERRQGRGTAVLRHSSDRPPFCCQCLVGPDESRIVPTGRVLTMRQGTVCAEDRISPEAASMPVARSLGVAPGTPILRILRIAFGLDGSAVEHRVSRTARLDYAVAIE